MSLDRGPAKRCALELDERSPRDLAAVVDFYDDRFAMRLTAQDRSDLGAFLQTL